jgi:signal peptidase I
MNAEGVNMRKNKWVAVLMGLAMPGLGQIYNGEIIKGLSCYAILLALNIAGTRWSVLLSDQWLIFGVLCTVTANIGVYALAVIDAFRKAGTLNADDLPTRYNRWYFYLAVWLMGFLVIPSTVYGYAKDNFLEAYSIPTSSMEPAVLKGDLILADKTAYRRMAPRKGDIVIFVYSDDRSKRFIKRVEALPGNLITNRDGAKQEVPHGFIYVLGDNRQNSLDSRNFGFVALSDVIAKARQVYFSSGDNGIRWSRIGASLSGSAQ